MAKLHIPQYDRQAKARSGLQRLLDNDIFGAMVMLMAAVAALIIANTALYPSVQAFIDSTLSIQVGELSAELPVISIVNDVLITIFFLMIGIELKYEFTVGELSNVRNAMFPIMAAAGASTVPVIIYFLINTFAADGTMDGWAVPVATDIAFALGVLALLGKRISPQLRTFFATFTIADDIIAIVIIAVFFTSDISVLWLVISVGIVFGLIFLNRSHVYSLWPYMILGIALLSTVYMSGVHATVSGVILAFTLPTKSQFNQPEAIRWIQETMSWENVPYQEDTPLLAQKSYLRESQRLEKVARYSVPPIIRLERVLNTFSTYAVLPIFAFTNALIPLGGFTVTQIVTSPIALGIGIGLIVGKPIGALLMSSIIVKTKFSSLPRNVTWSSLVGVGILAGVGFTMAILMAGLAFTDPEQEMIAKIGILGASFIAGVTGYIYLRITQAGKNFESEGA